MQVLRRIFARKRAKAAVLIILVVMLVISWGVTEYALYFIVNPWIRYFEFWLKYFTLVYAAVASMIAYYLAGVIPNLPLEIYDVKSGAQACGVCGACILTNGGNCEQDPVPTSAPALGQPIANNHDPQAGPTHMTVFIMNFINCANLDYLKPQLTSRGVLTLHELDELRRSALLNLKYSEQMEHLLSIISHKGWPGVEGMIESLRAETEHSGHKELADLLTKNYHGATGSEPERCLKENGEAESTPSAGVGCTGREVLQAKPGMNVIGSRVFKILSSQQHLFEWKEYGVILNVQDNTMTDDCPIELKIHVCLSGQFIVPPELELISAVYYIAASGKLAKPVFLEIQHCVNIRSKKELSYLSFVGECTALPPPYNLRNIPGKPSFSDHTPYGLISLKNDQLGLVAVARQKVKRSVLFPLVHTTVDIVCKYRLMVFYARIGDTEWIALIVITRDHAPWLQAVKEYYPNEFLLPGRDKEVVFEKETITPVIPEDGTSLSNGWKIMPQSEPGILKQKVDNLNEPGQLSLGLRWTGPQESEPPSLDYRVDLKGAKRPANFIRISFKPSSLRAHFDDIASVWTSGLSTKTPSNPVSTTAETEL